MAKIGPYSFRFPEKLNELYDDLRTMTLRLSQDLRSLTPVDNFEGFECEVTFSVGATTDVQIPNKFRDGRIPTRFIVVDTDAELSAHRGVGTWDTNFVYLRNAAGATGAVAKIQFIA